MTTVRQIGLGLFWMALVFTAACNSGTTVLGEQLAPQTLVPEAGSAGSGNVAAPDADTTDDDHNFFDDACDGRSCGELCGPGPGSGFESLRFCDRSGDCVSGSPQCNEDEPCGSSNDCDRGADFQPTCLLCTDGSMSCTEPQCVDNSCRYPQPVCQSGAMRCGQDGSCPLPADADAFCASTLCVFAQCFVFPRACSFDYECQGKHCGDVCRWCDPDDPRCDELPMTCNLFGECVSGETFCR